MQQIIVKANEDQPIEQIRNTIEQIREVKKLIAGDTSLGKIAYGIGGTREELALEIYVSGDEQYEMVINHLKTKSLFKAVAEEMGGLRLVIIDIGRVAAFASPKPSVLIF